MKTIYIFIISLILPRLNALANIEDELPSASIGYMITDLRTGQVVAEHNARRMLIPASVMKVVTVAAALDKLGSDYRFTTEVSVDGSILNDTVYGNLYLKANGDPTLTTNLIDSLKSISLKHIRGRLLTDALNPEINPTWMVEDIGSDYGVGWSRLNYKNNEILINDDFRATELDAILADITFDLALEGITIDQDEFYCNSTRHIISKIHSPRMQDICQDLMSESINLYAEAVGRSLGENLNCEEGLKEVAGYMKNIGVDQRLFKPADFCGLSRGNLIAPQSLITLLVKNSQNRSFLATFPTAGKDGTVKRFLKSTPLKGRVIAKSGSMAGILAYAGYLLDNNGDPTYAFAIIINNAIEPTSTIRNYVEKWFMKYFL